MMLDAVTFDLGGARPPLFVFPDASGLAPLTLPDEFLRGQGHQPPSEFPSALYTTALIPNSLPIPPVFFSLYFAYSSTDLALSM